jgi:hypothetical protein
VSAQQQALTPTAQPAPLAVVSGPMAELKPFLNDKGEMDVANLQFGERLERFQSFMAQNKYNLPLWATNLLAQFPAGTTLLPMPYYPTKQDAWRGADARKMQLKEGHVEPSADFIINLGNLLGVTLRKVFEGPVNMDGNRMYSVRYNAYLMLPNGAMLTVEEEGKDQMMYHEKGLQAHIVENTRKKAKRNAIKALLNIPTTMTEGDFDRPWVLLRPLFHAGSPETDRILAEQAAIAEQSRRLLYSPVDVPSGGQTVDVQASKPAMPQELSVAQVIQRVREAANMAALDALAKEVADMRLTTAERDQIKAAYADQKKLIEEAAKKDQGGF